MGEWRFSKGPTRVVVRGAPAPSRLPPDPRRTPQDLLIERFVARSKESRHEHIRLDEGERIEAPGPLPLHRPLEGPLRRDPRPLAQVTHELIEIIEVS